MRNHTIALNSIVAVFFAGFLAYTFAARQHLDSLAREFVIEKTLHYAEPLVVLAAEALESPVVQKVLSDKQSETIRQELSDYRNDPAAYIADLTRQKLLPPNLLKPNPLLQKVVSLKEKIRTFYDDTLAALIADLRIFSISNLVAAVIALGLCYWSRQNIRQSLVWFSFLMFVAVLCCSYLYVDDLTFFRILFRTHLGWWYPVFLGVVLAGLYLDYGRAGQTAEENVQPGKI